MLDLMHAGIPSPHMDINLWYRSLLAPPQVQNGMDPNRPDPNIMPDPNYYAGSVLNNLDPESDPKIGL